MKAFRLILFPFSILYGIGLFFRNLLFDIGILPSKAFPIAVINVGNLAAGGTGKSPHTEYLMRLLGKSFKLSTLSRGYGRKTSGFLEVKKESTFFEVGDEPRMFKNNFKDIPVFVDTNRVRGIEKIRSLDKEVECVLLDDAYQHRYVTPGLNILLTEYSRLYTHDYLLPVGYLRESKSGAKRADIIIVTKCPTIFSPVDARAIRKGLKTKPYQKVYFSYFKYGQLKPLYKKNDASPILNKKLNLVLATGIAKPASLLFSLKDRVNNIEHLKFPDHHIFTITDVNKIAQAYKDMAGENKIILTTEKDAMRFYVSGIEEVLGELPIFYLPVEVEFHGKDKEEFDENIITYVKRNITSN